MSNSDVAIQFFLQMSVIMVTCRTLGWFGRKYLGQTQVVMEMVAGVFLGPSLFGAFAPRQQAWLFPKVLEVRTEHGVTLVAHPNMTVLYALAQLGLVIYMFVVGLELDLKLLRGRTRAAILVSGSGIVVPFLLAASLMPYLMRDSELFTSGTSHFVALLFVGASVSITAFPMLARILYESGIAATSLGALVLAAGSIDDAIAWCLLALVLALFKNTPETAWLAVGGGLVYGVLMSTVGRRVFATFERIYERQGELSTGLFTSVMLVLVVCAYVTDLIGVYAVFGAFIFGASMPKQRLAKELGFRLGQTTTSILLPMFFVYSGLNTKIGLVNSPKLWSCAAIVILASVLGKGVACALAARAAGETWRHSGIVGALMNARGLMELILLNVGLERGIITPTFFTIMVMMAVITTAIASPLYQLLSRGLGLEGARRAQAPAYRSVRESLRETDAADGHPHFTQHDERPATHSG